MLQVLTQLKCFGSIPNSFTARTFRKMTTFWRPEDAEHIVDGLRKAGLPVA